MSLGEWPGAARNRRDAGKGREREEQIMQEDSYVQPCGLKEARRGVLCCRTLLCLQTPQKVSTAKARLMKGKHSLVPPQHPLQCIAFFALLGLSSSASTPRNTVRRYLCTHIDVHSTAWRVHVRMGLACSRRRPFRRARAVGERRLAHERAIEALSLCMYLGRWQPCFIPSVIRSIAEGGRGPLSPPCCSCIVSSTCMHVQ